MRLSVLLVRLSSDIDLTAEAILDLWQAAIPALENWWQELHDDIVNDPNLSDAAMGEALSAARNTAGLYW